MSVGKTIGVDVEVRTKLSKAEQDFNRFMGIINDNKEVDIKVEINDNILEVRKDLKSLIADAKKLNSLNTTFDKIGKSFANTKDIEKFNKAMQIQGKIEFESFEKSIGKMTNSLSVLEKVFDGFKFDNFKVDVFDNLNKSLDGMHTTLKTIKQDFEAISNARSFKDIQNDIDFTESQIEHLQNEQLEKKAKRAANKIFHQDPNNKGAIPESIRAYIENLYANYDRKGRRYLFPDEYRKLTKRELDSGKYAHIPQFNNSAFLSQAKAYIDAGGDIDKSRRYTYRDDQGKKQKISMSVRGMLNDLAEDLDDDIARTAKELLDSYKGTRKQQLESLHNQLKTLQSERSKAAIRENIDLNNKGVEGNAVDQLQKTQQEAKETEDAIQNLGKVDINIESLSELTSVFDKIRESIDGIAKAIGEVDSENGLNSLTSSLKTISDLVDELKSKDFNMIFNENTNLGGDQKNIETALNREIQKTKDRYSKAYDQILGTGKKYGIDANGVLGAIYGFDSSRTGYATATDFLDAFSKKSLDNLDPQEYIVRMQKFMEYVKKARQEMSSELAEDMKQLRLPTSDVNEVQRRFDRVVSEAKNAGNKDAIDELKKLKGQKKGEDIKPSDEDLNLGSSIDKINSESAAFKELAESAEVAAKAKHEFASANEMVSGSTTTSSDGLDKEKSKMKEIADAAEEAKKATDSITNTGKNVGSDISIPEEDKEVYNKLKELKKINAEYKKLSYADFNDNIYTHKDHSGDVKKGHATKSGLLRKLDKYKEDLEIDRYNREELHKKSKQASVSFSGLRAFAQDYQDNNGSEALKKAFGKENEDIYEFLQRVFEDTKKAKEVSEKIGELRASITEDLQKNKNMSLDEALGIVDDPDKSIKQLESKLSDESKQETKPQDTSSIGKTTAALEEEAQAIDKVQSKQKELQATEKTSGATTSNEQLENAKKTADALDEVNDKSKESAKNTGDMFSDIKLDSNAISTIGLVFEDISKSIDEAKSKIKDVGNVGNDLGNNLKLNSSVFDSYNLLFEGIEQKIKDVQNSFEQIFKGTDISKMLDMGELDKISEKSKESNQALEDMFGNFKIDSTALQTIGLVFEDIERSIEEVKGKFKDFGNLGESFGNNLKLDSSVFNSYNLLFEGIEQEVKEVQNALENAFKGIKFSDDSLNLDSFADVGSKLEESISSSVEKVASESEAFEKLATGAREAASAKSEFASANEKVSSSANESSGNLDKEKSKMEEVKGAAKEASDAKEAMAKADEGKKPASYQEQITKAKDALDRYFQRNDPDRVVSQAGTNPNKFMFTTASGVADRTTTKINVGMDGIVHKESQTAISYEALEKEILKTDSAIVKLENDIKKDQLNNIDTSNAQKELDSLREKLSTLTDEYDKYRKNTTYALNDNLAADFSRRRAENIEQLERKYAQDDVRRTGKAGNRVDEKLARHEETQIRGALSSLDDLDKLETKLRESGNLTEDFQNKVDNLKTSLNSIGDSEGFKKWTEDLEKAQTEAQEAIKKTEEAQKKSQREADSNAKREKNSVLSTLDKDERRLLMREENPNNKYTTNYIAQVHEQIDAIQQLKTALKDLDNVESKREDIGKVLENTRHLDARAQARENVLATEKQMEGMKAKIEKIMSRNTAMGRDFMGKFEALKLKIEPEMDGKAFDKIKAEVSKLEGEINKAGKTGPSFLEGLKNRIVSITQSAIAMSLSFYDVINIGKQALSIVKDIDDAYTEMRKVSNESEGTLKNFQKESYDIAGNIGTTGQQMQQSTADWMRLGESINDASKSAEASNILLNVSEFDSIDSATESLVSMASAYSDLDKMQIVDKLNEIGRIIA